MSELFRIILTIAQLLYTLWPLFLIIVIAYSVWGFPLRSLWRRLKNNLLATWTALVVIWLITLFAEGPNLSLFPEPYNSGIFLGGFALLVTPTLFNKLKVGKLIGKIGDALAGRAQARLSMRQMRALQDIKNLDPYHFEELVAELYRAEGYRVRRVGQSGDHGVDVEVYTPKGERWIVQCKRYRDTVGEQTVRELYGVFHHERAQRAILVTSAETTLAAETWARGKPIDLIDGPTLMRWIERVNAGSRPTLLDRLAAAIQAFVKPRVSFEGRGQNSGVTIRQQPASNGGSRSANGRQQPERQPQRERQPQPQPARQSQPERKPRPERPTSAAQPAVVRPIERQVVHTAPPDCPRCRIPMVVRPPQPNDRPGRVLYRCQNYPRCRVVVEGNPAQPSPRR